MLKILLLTKITFQDQSQIAIYLLTWSKWQVYQQVPYHVKNCSVSCTVNRKCCLTEPNTVVCVKYWMKSDE